MKQQDQQKRDQPMKSLKSPDLQKFLSLIKKILQSSFANIVKNPME